MHGPATPGWLLLVLCSASGAYCLVRMRSCTGTESRVAGSEALMGFGMAAMAAPDAVVPTVPWAWLLYAAVFGTAGLGVLWWDRGSPTVIHRLHHLVGSLAMVYMAVTMAPGGAHAGHSGPGGLPLLTGALLVYFAAFVLHAGLRLVPVPSRAGGAAVAWGARPELVLACRLSMGVAMVAMLLTV
ncbi:DUF5134 domain-containing protein [Streptomyces sp. NPDC059176]|uniref:DUF5134 domain-containing protein n=1 Tax=unclassified Streptomyces TaxID=2593676 RepID=UPI0036958D95